MVALWNHSTMASLTIKQVPQDLLARIKQRAEDNGRSMNKEIIHALEVRYPAEMAFEEMEAEAKALWKRIGSDLKSPYNPDWRRERS